VDMIIRDLVDIAINLTRTNYLTKHKQKIRDAAEETILKKMLGDNIEANTKSKFLNMLRQGALDSYNIDIDIPENRTNVNMLSPTEFPLNDIFDSLRKQIKGPTKKQQKMSIGQSRTILESIEGDKIINEDQIKQQAIRSVEQDGIVFIDEIDKIVSPPGEHYADASAEGVQRDLLPIIEGCVVNTKHGNINTSHILFCCSGAFHRVKPSDLLPELQGRLPIRVELKGLNQDDFYRILTETENNLIKQQTALLKTESVVIKFNEESIREIARIAAELNTTVENIGARRLLAVIERIVEEISFDAPDKPGTEIVIDAKYVKDRLDELLTKTDLSKFII